MLIEISPVFAKLKNPILRKTVAKVATLQQVAVIGNIPVEELVNRMRKEVGQGTTSGITEGAEYLSAEPPQWFWPEKITDHFDATILINTGESPMNEVLHRVKNLKQENIFELSTPFVPAPIIEILLEKGFRVWVVQEKSNFISYICKL